MNIGVRLIQIAAVYIIMGLIMGPAMAKAKDSTLSAVHAHVSHVGWATIAIAGILYILVPNCGRNRLAKLHFWGHNIGLPVMMVSLALYMLEVTAAEKAVAAGSTSVVGSLLLFPVNLVRNAQTGPPQ